MADELAYDELRQRVLQSLTVIFSEKRGKLSHLIVNLNNHHIPEALLASRKGLEKISDILHDILVDATKNMPAEYKPEPSRNNTSPSSITMSKGVIYCDYVFPGEHHELVQAGAKALNEAVDKDRENYRQGLQASIPNFLSRLSAELEKDLHIESLRTHANSAAIDAALERTGVLAQNLYTHLWEMSKESPYVRQETIDANKKQLSNAFDSLGKACGANAKLTYTNLYLQNAEAFILPPFAGASQRTDKKFATTAPQDTVAPKTKKSPSKWAEEILEFPVGTQSFSQLLEKLAPKAGAMHDGPKELHLTLIAAQLAKQRAYLDEPILSDKRTMRDILIEGKDTLAMLVKNARFEQDAVRITSTQINGLMKNENAASKREIRETAAKQPKPLPDLEAVTDHLALLALKYDDFIENLPPPVKKQK